MKRIAAALLLVGAMALALTAGASADAPGDSSGAACSEIVTGGAIYNHQPDPDGPVIDNVTATVGYAAPTCKNVHYTLVISYMSGEQPKVKVQSIKGDASTTPTILLDGTVVYTLSFRINNVVADGQVCAATYTAGAGQVFDRSPDDRPCALIPTDESGGGGSGTF
jgi:hypothetical protein